VTPILEFYNLDLFFSWFGLAPLTGLKLLQFPRVTAISAPAPAVLTVVANFSSSSRPSGEHYLTLLSEKNIYIYIGSGIKYKLLKKNYLLTPVKFPVNIK
jgi:hypothetical protein